MFVEIVWICNRVQFVWNKYTMLYGPSAKVSLLYQMAEQETTCGGAKVGRVTYDHAIVSSSKVK